MISRKHENKTLKAKSNKTAQKKRIPNLVSTVPNNNESFQLRQLQSLANNSKQVKQLQFIQNSADHFTQSNQNHGSTTSNKTVQQKPTPNKAVIQRLKFSNHSGISGMFSSYSKEENQLNKLERQAITSYNKVHKYIDYKEYSGRISHLHGELGDISQAIISPEEYTVAGAILTNIIQDSDDLKVEIVGKSAERREKLSTGLTAHLTVSGEPSERHDTVTPTEYAEIEKVLEGIYVKGNSIISIDLENGETFNLSQRASSLDLAVPAAITTLELAIKRLTDKKNMEEAEINSAWDNPEITELEKSALRAKRNALWEDPALESLKKKYLAAVKEYVRDETLNDMLKIVQTSVGRDLLKTMTDEKYRKNAKVVIAVRDSYVAPTGGPSSSGGGKVTYAPQAIKDRDTVNRAEGGAIPRMAALKADNPWQENTRTDITLFHELVHTHHVQAGTLMEKDDLVEDDGVSHAADKQFDGGGMAAGSKIGVPKEEYQTVGLGEFSDDKFTENAYRKQRRDLGEEVAPRTQYTHVDHEGRRAGDESAM